MRPTDAEFSLKVAGADTRLIAYFSRHWSDGAVDFHRINMEVGLFQKVMPFCFGNKDAKRKILQARTKMDTRHRLLPFRKYV